MDINNRAEWVRCPICRNKTRLQIRADTELKIFPSTAQSVDMKV